MQIVSSRYRRRAPFPVLAATTEPTTEPTSSTPALTTLSAVILLAAAILTTSACGADPRFEGIVSSTGTAFPIINGSRDPRGVVLTPGQKLALGYLARANGRAFCSGSLIAPRAVLTAEHCVDAVRAEAIVFGIGPLFQQPIARLAVARVDIHPNYDSALLILAEDATVAVPGITPLSMNRSDLTHAWIGRKVDAAGFGETRSRESGLFFGSVEIVGYDTEMVSVDGKGKEGICFGDSGGPILWQDSNKAEPVIVGTESYGDPSCIDVDFLTRTDRVAGWVDEKLAGLPGAIAACGNVTPAGTCEGTVLRSCRDGLLSSEDCAASGGRCGLRGAGTNGCLPEACAGVDYNGVCEDNVARWCGASGQQVVDCAASGQQCAPDATGAYRCACVQCGGKCTDIMTSLENCGGCDKRCDPPNGGGQCVNGVCTVAGCQSGFADDDSNAANGCEEMVGGGGGSSGCSATAPGSFAIVGALLALAAGLRERGRRCARHIVAR